MLAVIGGSGLAKLVGLERIRREVWRTTWGSPSCALSFGELAGTPIVFLARHGYGHTIAPHDINYRANVWALKEAGATGILAVATVGGISTDLPPGALVVPDQIIDYTTGRQGTFYSGPDQPVVHIDFTEPYDEALRGRLLAAGQAVGEPLVDGGCYGCTQGPRLETAAEIRRMARDGCHVVGMTGMPEAALARELELPYATLAVVANAAAGLGASARQVVLEDIAEVLENAMDRVVGVLARAVAGAPEPRG
jgi:5'-deoxy-5'-methylthioadenosine phosphorylase